MWVPLYLEPCRPLRSISTNSGLETKVTVEIIQRREVQQNIEFKIKKRTQPALGALSMFVDRVWFCLCDTDLHLKQYDTN